jgi:hypothetical protein
MFRILPSPICIGTKAEHRRRGLAWHTDDTTLRAKFEEFGQVEEAVRLPNQLLDDLS